VEFFTATTRMPAAEFQDPSRARRDKDKLCEPKKVKKSRSL
jgi:hypothetical protein